MLTLSGEADAPAHGAGNWFPRGTNGVRRALRALTTHNAHSVEPVPSHFFAKLKRLPGGALFAVAGSDRGPDLQTYI